MTGLLQLELAVFAVGCVQLKRLLVLVKSSRLTMPMNVFHLGKVKYRLEKMIVIKDYAREIHEAILGTKVTQVDGNLIALHDSFYLLKAMIIDTARRGNKTILIGNGGSSQIASHIAIDYCKNGGWRAMAFNDVAALTCLANDFGYEYVFAKQLEMHAVAGDTLILISSSGQSANILRAATTAQKTRIPEINIVTFTGFGVDNPLRRHGALNFYVPSCDYGIVEIAHLTLLHSIVSMEMGLVNRLEPFRRPIPDATVAVAARGKTTIVDKELYGKGRIPGRKMPRPILQEV